MTGETVKTSMATLSIGGSLEEKIEAIAGAGFDGLELLDDDLRRSRMSPAECAARCADHGLTIDAYQPFRRAEGVPAEEFIDVLARFRSELEVMSALGVTSILVVSNTDADAIASRDQSVTQLAALADTAAEQGVTVMFEALAWGTHIRSLTDARDTVRQVGLPHLHLVVDTFHLLAGGEGAQALSDLPGESVGLVQLADAPWLDLDLKSWSRGHRCFPGQGDLDLLPPVAALICGGYAGPLSLEIFNPGYRTRPASVVAREGAHSLRQFIAELSERTGANATTRL
ncbi:sugar phosphate isomerase/epimerase [Kineosporia sp. NBRC 101731]|uniref:sugar phosphate isomerase/epimerase family protein n=1 Tax=Kineosporia sp. NBRC 101731 TaxID=3032199 RepID=UPI00249FD1B7|nr:sugar phosphate isomerase/epimerase [Kineosporia sp. NBRC 101731]GLY30723.1 hypothetical protein Kisp02_40880 [Kineosporia sp. NBRC 101731]